MFYALLVFPMPTSCPTNLIASNCIVLINRLGLLDEAHKIDALPYAAFPISLLFPPSWVLMSSHIFQCYQLLIENNCSCFLKFDASSTNLLQQMSLIMQAEEQFNLQHAAVCVLSFTLLRAQNLKL